MVEETGGPLFGADLEEYCRQMREKAEAFFAQAGKDPLEIYRIEQFEPIKQDDQWHGKFYDGDSYVVLKKQRNKYDIHYWHGENATADEMGSSAALSVQLSVNLQLASSHHLEEQGYETDLFQSYFKQGLFYLEGGVESGFRHVEPEVINRLLHIKGKRYPRVFNVPISHESLNEGDCFILDQGDKIYIWYGPKCNMFERQKASEVHQAIWQNDRKTKATKLFVQDGNAEIAKAFWDALGGEPAQIKPAVDDDPPAGTEDERLKYTLYHISDSSGDIVKTEITERPLKRSTLIDSDSYILETYDAVFCWNGKDASDKEKYAGLKIAKDLVKENGKPKGTKVSRIAQGCEDSTFKSFFDGFYPALVEDYSDSKTKPNQDVSAVVAQQAKAKELMLKQLGPMENVVMKVYVVGDDFKTLTEVTDPKEKGFFFAESCYIIHLKSPTYQFFINWVGPSPMSVNTAAMSDASVNLVGGVMTFDETRTIVRKGHEDDGLLAFFPDGFFILDETRIPMEEWWNKTRENGVMFRVQATHGGSARAIEQNGRASQYLNSGDSFFVVHPQCTGGFVWQGVGSNEQEQTSASSLFNHLSTMSGSGMQCGVQKEGEESAAFWDSIGGQGEYSKVKESMGISPDFEPRLFAVSTLSGFLWMEEVPAFGQEDLNNNDCYILDAYSTIYVWIGNGSNKAEKKGVHTRAKKYLEDTNDSRDKTQVMIEEVLAGREPPQFQVQFIQWEPEVAHKWLETDSTFMAEKAMEEEKKQAEVEANRDPFEGYLDPKTNKFPYETLKTSFPPGVHPSKKEYYLSDEEFVQHLGPKEAWAVEKKWKQERKKKELGLF